MAENPIPQYQDTQPILQPTQIQSAAEGYDQFSQVLDKLSTAGMEESKQMASDASNAMFVTSVGDIEDLKAKAQIAMTQDPSHAATYNKTMQDSVSAVTTNASLNSEDRAKLNAYSVSANDDVALKTAETTVKQTQLSSGIAIVEGFPNQLDALRTAIRSGDHDFAKTLSDGMVGYLDSGMRTGSLKLETGAKMLKSIHDVMDEGATYNDMASQALSGNVNAQQYHTVNSSPYSTTQNQVTKTNEPAEGNTVWLADTSNQSKNFEEMKSDINNNRVYPSQTNYYQKGISTNQQKELTYMIQGKQMADGIINSNQPYPALVATVQQLNLKGSDLSPAQNTLKNNLEVYTEEMKSNPMAALGQTALGKNIMQNFIDKNAAIDSTYVYSAAGRQKALDDNKNDMVNKSLSVMEAMHWPVELQRPIPLTDLANYQNGFNLNQDPSIVPQTLSGYSKTNQAYIANSLKDPGQRIITQAIINAGNQASPQEIKDMVSANQSGREKDYAQLSFSDKTTNWGTATTRIGTNLSDQIRFNLLQYGRTDGASLNSAMVSTTLNLAKYLAVQNQDYGLNSWQKYVDQASRFYSETTPMLTGNNYIVNPKQLPQRMSQSDLEILADYATYQGYQTVNKGYDPRAYYAFNDQSPMTMRITNTGRVQAVDSYGNLAFDQPYDTKLMTFAKRDVMRRMTEDQKYKTFQAYRQTQKTQFVD